MDEGIEMTDQQSTTTETVCSTALEVGDTVLQGAYRYLVLDVEHNWIDPETAEWKTRVELVDEDEAIKADLLYQDCSWHSYYGRNEILELEVGERYWGQNRPGINLWK